MLIKMEYWRARFGAHCWHWMLGYSWSLHQLGILFPSKKPWLCKLNLLLAGSRALLCWAKFDSVAQIPAHLCPLISNSAVPNIVCSFQKAGP